MPPPGMCHPTRVVHGDAAAKYPGLSGQISSCFVSESEHADERQRAELQPPVQSEEGCVVPLHVYLPRQDSVPHRRNHGERQFTMRQSRANSEGLQTLTLDGVEVAKGIGSQVKVIWTKRWVCESVQKLLEMVQ